MNLTEVIDDFVDHGFPVEKLIGGIMTEWPYPAGTDSLGPDGSIVQRRRLVGVMAWRIDNDYTLELGGAHLEGSSSALGGSWNQLNST